VSILATVRRERLSIRAISVRISGISVQCEIDHLKLSEVWCDTIPFLDTYLFWALYKEVHAIVRSVFKFYIYPIMISNRIFAMSMIEFIITMILTQGE
jgi:hypothetical protein